MSHTGGRSLYILLAFLAAAASPVCAIEVRDLKPEGYVSDFARVVNAIERQELEQYGALVEKRTGAQLAFVTVETLDGASIEDFANDLYRHWGIGRSETDEGTLLLLVVRDHNMRLEVGHGLEHVFTGGTSGELLRSMRPALRANQFGTALLQAGRTIGERIAKAKGVALEQAPVAPPAQNTEPVDIPWPVILGGAFLLFWMMSVGRRRRRYGGGPGDVLSGIVLGNILNRGMYMGGHRSGGGGFGGYDSSDSFGGFGGGESGGEGATSNW